MPKMSRGRMLRDDEIKPKKNPEDDLLAMKRQSTLTGEVSYKNNPKDQIPNANSEIKEEK